MDTAPKVKILDETICIVHSANTIKKVKNQIILPPPQLTGLFNFCMATNQGEWKPNSNQL